MHSLDDIAQKLARIDERQEILIEQAEKTYEETRKTNGRVTILEQRSESERQRTDLEFKRIWGVIKYGGGMLAIIAASLLAKGILTIEQLK